METTAKELVRRLFSLQTVSRLPVLPFISCWSAKVGQVSVREMWADPSLLVHSLLQAHQVAGSDWVAGPLDITLEAEAGGCRLEWGEEGAPPQVVSHPWQGLPSIPGDRDLFLMAEGGRLAAVMEMIKRIAVIRGRQVAVAGTVTGPCTLAGLLLGEDPSARGVGQPELTGQWFAAAGDMALRLLRAYGELRVEAVVLAEADMPPGGIATPPLLEFLRSWINISRFYRIAPLFYGSSITFKDLELLASLGIRGVMAGHWEFDAMRLTESPLLNRICIGVDVFSDPASVSEMGGWKEIWEGSGKRGLFLTGEITYHASVAQVRKVVMQVAGK